MYNILKHAHSGLRWVLLLALVVAIVAGFQAWKRGGQYKKGAALFALIVTHTQLILGLILYFISPLVNFNEGFMKNEVTRFYTVEHLTTMIIAIVLITIGYSRAKRKADDAAAGKAMFVFFFIGLILILLGIPWPFRDLGGGWF
jgi:hypothetical protein